MFDFQTFVTPNGAVLVRTDILTGRAWLLQTEAGALSKTWIQVNEPEEAEDGTGK